MFSDDEDEVNGPVEISSRGTSTSTQHLKARVISIWNQGVDEKCITLAKRWEDDWDPTNQQLWQQVAGYIALRYTFQETVSGQKITQNLAPGVAKQYFAKLFDLAKFEKFAEDEDAQKFFECNLAPSNGDRTPQQIWYHGLKDNLRKTAWNRANDAGDLKDGSVTPVGPQKIKKGVEKCTKMDTAEASHKKLVMNSNRSLGGRPLEVTYLRYDKMRYNEEFFAAVIDSPQVLVSQQVCVFVCRGR